MLPFNDGYYLQRIQRATAFETLPEDHVYEYLRNLSTGSAEMNVDGGTPANFDWVVPAGTKYKSFALTRLNFSLIDGAIRWGQFGGLGSALTNGLLIQAIDQDGTVLQHFGTNRNPIKANEHFANLSGVDNIVVPAAGDDALAVRFTIARSGNKMTLLPNWRIRIIVQDDIDGLSFFRVMVQGILKQQ